MRLNYINALNTQQRSENKYTNLNSTNINLQNNNKISKNSIDVLNYMHNSGNINKSITFGAELTHLKDISKAISDVKLLDKKNIEITSRVLQKLGVKDIEYLSQKAGDTVNRLFIKCKNFVYNMTLGKISDDIITGFVSKEYDNGQNELFMLRGEFLETNKSQKLQLSFMSVVQIGLDDNSKIIPKQLKEFSGNMANEFNRQDTMSGYRKTGESYSEFNILKGLLGDGISENVTFSPSVIDTKALNTIDIKIQLANSDIRRNVTFSIDKETGIMSETGVAIGKNISKKIKRQHDNWDIVTGPYGDIETPKNINITEEGIDEKSVDSIIRAPLDAYLCTLTTPNHITVNEFAAITDGPIKDADRLNKLISIATRLLNNNTIQVPGVYHKYSRPDWRFNKKVDLENLVEVARNLLYSAE